jgi:RNA polymerase sigma factor (TIGR02999 family)
MEVASIGTDGLDSPVKEASGHKITQLLKAWSGGETAALEKLVPLVYKELRRMARRYMAQERPGHTLQTTALVHEAYVRLVGPNPASLANRAQFFALCAQVMRRILVDWARARRAQKRGGDAEPLRLEEGLVVTGEPGKDLVALDDALKVLSAMDARKGQVVELRFFGGLSVEETAAALKVSHDTVTRDWKFARSWLRHELRWESERGA